MDWPLGSNVYRFSTDNKQQVLGSICHLTGNGVAFHFSIGRLTVAMTLFK